MKINERSSILTFDLNFTGEINKENKKNIQDTTDGSLTVCFKKIKELFFKINHN